jgi:hypothetical protein
MEVGKDIPALEFSAGFSLPVSRETFCPAQSFQVSTRSGLGIGIASIFDEFKRRFLSDAKWVVGPHPQMAIRVWKLNRDSTSAELLEQLPAGAEPEVPLSVLFEILRAQSAGERGSLTTDGIVNVFFVRDSMDLLHTVRVHWFGYGWHVGSYPVTRVIPWRTGAQIVTRWDCQNG